MKPKFCKDCVHFRPDFWCQSEKVYDYVTGREKMRSCYEIRQTENFCGPRARWFKSKKR